MRISFPRAIAALLLGAALAACAAPAAPQPATPTPPPPTAVPTLGQPVALRIGQSAAVGPVTVTLEAITDDSRCPTQVACAWEGAATARVGVRVGQDGGLFQLTLNGQDRETEAARATVGGYVVRFVRLAPYPAEPAPIVADAYVAELIVEEAPAGYAPVSGAGFEGVIVPERDARAVDPRADGYWTPSEADVAALEAGLAAFLKTAAAERSPDLWQKQGGYKRQYSGLVRGGRRLVYASFFCSTTGEEWRSQVLFVMDGGDCFFQLTYDVERGTYGDLVVNGQA